MRSWLGIKRKGALLISSPAIVRTLQLSSVSKWARLKRGPVEHHANFGRAEGHFDSRRRAAVGQQHGAADGMSLAEPHDLAINGRQSEKGTPKPNNPLDWVILTLEEHVDAGE